MKIRSVHPGFFSDSKVCALSFPARILWQGLWCFADDYGRGPWLAKAIEGAVFPRDEVDMDALMFEVMDQGLVELYGVNGDTYYLIPHWNDYQKPRYQGKELAPDPTKVKKARKINPVQVSPEIVQESARNLAEVRAHSARNGQGEREKEKEKEKEEEMEAEGRGSVRERGTPTNQKPPGTSRAEWAAALSLADERNPTNREALATHLLRSPDVRDQIRQRVVKGLPIDPDVLVLLDGIAKEAS